jgi:hypothetical protein
VSDARAARCPACGRPAAAARPRCLYCGAALPDAPLGPGADPATPAPEAAGRDELVLVLDLRAAPAPALARALRLPAWEAQQRARRGGFQLHRVAARAEAEAEAERLAEAGVPALALPAAEVRAAARPLVALGGRCGARRLELRAAKRRRLSVAADELLLVVAGPLTRQRQAAEPRQKTLILGIPRRWDDPSRLPGYRFHLHRRGDPQPLELDPESFEFEAHPPLGGPQVELRTWIESMAPRAPWDDGFRGLAPALAPSEPTGGPAAALPDRARRREQGAAVLDNLAQFRFYSAWRACLERRLRG